MRWFALFLGLGLLTGCAQGVRMQKFLAAETFLVPVGPTGDLAQVEFVEGYHDASLQPYAPLVEDVDGRDMARPQVLTSRGAIAIRPHRPVDLRVSVRHRGINRHGFLPVVAVNGGLHRALPTEVRPLPRKLSEAWSLPMSHLHNVYNDFTFEDGDLLLVELTDGQLTEQYLFRTRQLGFRGKGGANVLVQLPLPWSERTVSLSPVLALSFSMGYRFSSRNPTVRWAGDKLALVTSVGVGSTAVAATEVDVRQLNTLLNAALVGGGVEFYDILSIQVFGNLSSAFREAGEAPATLAIGFDAVQFGRATRNATTRLFRRNTLN